MSPLSCLPPVGRPAAEVTADDGELIAITVIEAVAAVTDSAPTHLPPLYDAVDPDALNRIFRTFGGDGTVTFQYSGCTVVVDADGTVAVYEEG